ncbi:hypothetical protein [Geodermatophilus sp. CPCC 206100]|uniref:hypothetical protein n=1 Tax=Geodermatophilus sp. CPCC 206100 TaxID=3020054 RepID=UPI003B00BF38
MRPAGLGATGLLQRLRAVPVTAAELRRVADEVLPALATPTLAAGVVDDRVDGPVAVLEEGERRLRVPLRDLAEDLTDAGVAATPEGLAAALISWVAQRPVPDAAAASAGIAVLDWTDRRETAVGWRVVVRRGAAARPWSPSVGLGRARLDVVRTAALARAADVGGELRLEGPVALWSHPEVPLLASAVLAAPERLLGRLGRAGLDVRDLHVVVTPRSPVACAGAAVAARLAGETGEPCQRLPWRQLAALRWV